MVGVVLSVLLNADTKASGAFRRRVCQLIECDGTRGLSRESSFGGLVVNFLQSQNAPYLAGRYALLTFAVRRGALGRSFWSLMVPWPGKPEAFFNQSVASNPAIGPPRGSKGLEVSELGHVLLNPKMVTLDALLEIFSEIVHRA